MRKLTARELIENAQGHFDAAEFLLNSNEYYTYFSAGFLYHLSFECLLKGWIELEEEKEYEKTHDLKKLVLQLSKKGQDQLQKNITNTTLFDLGDYFINSHSDLKLKILKLQDKKNITNQSISAAIIEHIDSLHSYRYNPGTIGSPDVDFYKKIYSSLLELIQQLQKEKKEKEEELLEKLENLKSISEKEMQEYHSKQVEQWSKIQESYQKQKQQTNNQKKNE